MLKKPVPILNNTPGPLLSQLFTFYTLYSHRRYRTCRLVLSEQRKVSRQSEVTLYTVIHYIDKRCQTDVPPFSAIL